MQLKNFKTNNMDLQTYLDKAIKANRQQRMLSSDQLTLGDLIDKLEPIVKRQPDRIELYGEEASVRYDFEYLFPTEIDSWRGSYAELALNYKIDGEEMTVSAFLQMLKDTVGKTLTGYKGGEFTMDRDTPVWVANYGNSGNTAVVEVVDNEYVVILVTGYREY
jgi:hypothetical protein